MKDNSNAIGIVRLENGTLSVYIEGQPEWEMSGCTLSATEYGDVYQGTDKLWQHTNASRRSSRYLIVSVLLKNSTDSHARKKTIYPYVHRLVATNCIEKTDPSQNCIDHIDGDRFNNKAENLRWCTAAENQHYRVQHELEFNISHNRDHSPWSYLKKGISRVKAVNKSTGEIRYYNRISECGRDLGCTGQNISICLRNGWCRGDWKLSIEQFDESVHDYIEIETAQRERHPMGFNWYTDGIVNIRGSECPDGFHPGKARRVNNK